MSTAQKIIAATSSTYGAGGSADPIGIDFDGANDYLYKSSDWTNNTNSKTFTFSAWYYPIKGTSATQHIMQSATGYTFMVGSMDSSGGYIHFDAGGTDTAFPFAVYANVGLINGGAGSVTSPDTWNHLLISLDTSDSNKRFVYVNGVNRTSDTEWYDGDGWYRNVEINFTTSAHSIGVNGNGGSGFFHGRLAGIYLDYTYRDLTTASNRYLFIDADNQYVTPPTGSIISFPFDDASAAATNSGTGGDYTLNGTIAQSGRGPNQYNAAVSSLDGSNDYLSASSISGLSDGKELTISFHIKVDTSATNYYIFTIGASGSSNDIYVKLESSGSFFGIHFVAENSSGTKIAEFEQGYSGTFPYAHDKWHNIAISIDLTSTSKRHVFVNGVDASVSWSTYTNDTIDLTKNAYRVGSDASNGTKLNGKISDLWFDSSYIDLSSSNPFFDTETYKPKSLGGDGSTPTGSSPKIYLPLRSDKSAGDNKGTAGDFTINSGHFVSGNQNILLGQAQHRGPSEFWGESVKLNGSNQTLSKSSNLGFNSTRKYTVVCSVLQDDGLDCVFDFQGGASPSTFYGGLKLEDSGGDYAFKVLKSDGGIIMNFGPDSGAQIPNDRWNNILISVDLSSTSKRWFYVNGSVPGSLKVRTHNTNGNTDLSNITTCKIGSRAFGGNELNGFIGFLYIAQEYIDFSVESNRLKFFDAFGYPVDLGSDGSTPTGNQPLVYMNKGFHLGTNLGSGGNFTPNNSPTDGGYVRNVD